jgi:hypothetical protein
VYRKGYQWSGVAMLSVPAGEMDNLAQNSNRTFHVLIKPDNLTCYQHTERIRALLKQLSGATMQTLMAETAWQAQPCEYDDVLNQVAAPCGPVAHVASSNP